MHENQSVLNVLVFKKQQSTLTFTFSNYDVESKLFGTKMIFLFSMIIMPIRFPPCNFAIGNCSMCFSFSESIIQQISSELIDVHFMIQRRKKFYYYYKYLSYFKKRMAQKSVWAFSPTLQ